jgi:gluconate 2-dehydrogenase gamma chain
MAALPEDSEPVVDLIAERPADKGRADPRTTENATAEVDRQARHRLSRRDLLKQVTVAVLPAAALAPTAAALPQTPSPAAAPSPLTVPVREALETLSAAESDILEAICARLIPTDALGPGAAEARAANYIDRALAGHLSSAREAYHVGLAAVDAYAQHAKGTPFAKLTPADQDAVLTDMENNRATGFKPNSLTFFNLVRAHTIDGTFGDPYYGGNANFVGWDLIGYPGVRLAVTANEQKMGVSVPSTHKSAYDYAMFSKKKVSAVNEHGADTHGH